MDKLTLNLSDVVVDASAADEHLPAGEYVAIASSVTGSGRPMLGGRLRVPLFSGVLRQIVSAFEAAGLLAMADSRALGDRSSVTVFLQPQKNPTA